MNKVLGVAIVCFSVTMAVVIGSRISPESMAIVVGVICGVAVSVPLSAMVLALSGRRRQEAEREERERSWERAGYPPVVVLQGPTHAGAGSGTMQPYLSAPSQGRAFLGGERRYAQPTYQSEPRSFRVVGEAMTEYENDFDGESRSIWSR